MYILIRVDDTDGVDTQLVGVYETLGAAQEDMRREYEQAMGYAGYDDTVEGPFISSLMASTDTLDEFSCWKGGLHWGIFHDKLDATKHPAG